MWEVYINVCHHEIRVKPYYCINPFRTTKAAINGIHRHMSKLQTTSKVSLKLPSRINFARRGAHAPSPRLWTESFGNGPKLAVGQPNNFLKNPSWVHSGAWTRNPLISKQPRKANACKRLLKINYFKTDHEKGDLTFSFAPSPFLWTRLWKKSLELVISFFELQNMFTNILFFAMTLWVWELWKEKEKTPTKHWISQKPPLFIISEMLSFGKI